MTFSCDIYGLDLYEPVSKMKAAENKGLTPFDPTVPSFGVKRKSKMVKCRNLWFPILVWCQKTEN